MKEPPTEKEGATEMMFCSLRCATAQALRSARTTVAKDGSWEITSGCSPELLAVKDEAIDALEKDFQKRFVQYCDPAIPLHLLVSYVAKSVSNELISFCCPSQLPSISSKLGPGSFVCGQSDC